MHIWFNIIKHQCISWSFFIWFINYNVIYVENIRYVTLSHGCVILIDNTLLVITYVHITWFTKLEDHESRPYPEKKTDRGWKKRREEPHHLHVVCFLCLECREEKKLIEEADTLIILDSWIMIVIKWAPLLSTTFYFLFQC